MQELVSGYSAVMTAPAPGQRQALGWQIIFVFLGIAALIAACVIAAGWPHAQNSLRLWGALVAGGLALLSAAAWWRP
jgi:hypothetical protein